MPTGVFRKRHTNCWSILSGVYARGSKTSHTGGKCVTCRRLHILPGHNCLHDRMTIKKSVKVSSKRSEEKGIAQFSKPQRCAEPATSQIDSIVLRVQLRKVQSYSAAHWMRDHLLHLVSVYILLERDIYSDRQDGVWCGSNNKARAWEVMQPFLGCANW